MTLVILLYLEMKNIDIHINMNNLVLKKYFLSVIFCLFSDSALLFFQSHD